MNSQEAITLLGNLEDALDSYCELNEEGKTAFRMAITALNCSEIPNNWIPCSERLPKYGQPVLTYNLEDDEYEVNHIIDEEDGEWFTYGVDAWMPLPTPYQPKEDES